MGLKTMAYKNIRPLFGTHMRHFAENENEEKALYGLQIY